MCWSGEVSRRPSAETHVDWFRCWTTPAAELLGDDQPLRVRMAALISLGRSREALDLPNADAQSDLHYIASLHAGLVAAASLPLNPWHEHQSWALAELAARDDQPALAAARAELARIWPDWTRWPTWLVIEPLVAPQEGRRELVRARLEQAAGLREVQAQQPWHVANLALGRIDDTAFAAMPTAALVPVLGCLARALRAELAGDAAAAQQAWRDYRALPSHQRLCNNIVPLPGLERLAEWKVEGR